VLLDRSDVAPDHAVRLWVQGCGKHLAPSQDLAKPPVSNGTRSYSPGHYVIFFNWYSGGGVQLDPLGTAVTNGLLCQPQVIMMVEKLEE
jgi:hypothetical protein